MKSYIEESCPIVKMTVVYPRDNNQSFYNLMDGIIENGSFYQCTVSGPAIQMRDTPEDLTHQQLLDYSFYILFVDLESAEKIREWVKTNV